VVAFEANRRRDVSVALPSIIILEFSCFLVEISTTSKVERIKEFQDVEHIPDLTPEEIQQIEEAGSELDKRVYMGHVFAG